MSSTAPPDTIAVPTKKSHLQRVLKANKASTVTITEGMAIVYHSSSYPRIKHRTNSPQHATISAVKIAGFRYFKTFSMERHLLEKPLQGVVQSHAPRPCRVIAEVYAHILGILFGESAVLHKFAHHFFMAVIGKIEYAVSIKHII